MSSPATPKRTLWLALAALFLPGGWLLVLGAFLANRLWRISAWPNGREESSA